MFCKIGLSNIVWVIDSLYDVIFMYIVRKQMFLLNLLFISAINFGELGFELALQKSLSSKY